MSQVFDTALFFGSDTSEIDFVEITGATINTTHIRFELLTTNGDNGFRVELYGRPHG